MIDSYYNDKMVERPSYLHNGNPKSKNTGFLSTQGFNEDTECITNETPCQQIVYCFSLKLFILHLITTKDDTNAEHTPDWRLKRLSAGLATSQSASLAFKEYGPWNMHTVRAYYLVYFVHRPSQQRNAISVYHCNILHVVASALCCFLLTRWGRYTWRQFSGHFEMQFLEWKYIIFY